MDRFKIRAQDAGIPDLLDKRGDETVAETGEELVEFLMKSGHPSLEMEALF